MIKKLLYQSGKYFIGLSVGKLFNTVVFILIARTLLSEKAGQFVFFTTLVTLITVFGDFGLNQWYQKRIEKGKEIPILQQLFSARIVTLIISLIFTFLFLILTKPFSPFISFLLLASLIFEAFLSAFEGYYLEKENVNMVSMKNVSKMTILLIGFLLFRNNFTIEVAVLFSFFGSFVTFVWFFPWKILMRLKKLSFDTALATLSSSRSYALLIITSYFYARGDSFVIEYSLGNSALGLYGAAYRYLESLSLLPTALAQNLFPVSAKKEGIPFHHFRQLFFITFLCGLVVASGTYFFSTFLTTGLFGQSFSGAAPIVRIFSLVLFLFFLNSPLSTIVQSSSLVKQFLPFGILNTVLNIVLNIALVPLFGITAAAWVMFISEFTGLLINLFFVKKIYEK